MIRALARNCYHCVVRSKEARALIRRTIVGEPLAPARPNFEGAFTFEDRARGSRRAVLIVAGYKSWLWGDTLARVKRFAPAGTDVCIVSPGVKSDALRMLCAENNWSMLVTEDNKLALAQNLAIEQLSAASIIHKLDEDVFISSGYFEGLEEGLEHVRASGVCDPGIAVPVLNVNGYSYKVFLEATGAAAEYKREFGELKISCMDVKVWSDGNAALWLWKRSLPLDGVAARFREQPFAYSLVPHRFSIGAILFSREMWEQIGGFLVGSPGALGVEEEHLCNQCMNRSRPIICIHNVLAGHFAFHPQESVMKANARLLKELDRSLLLKGL